MAQASPSYVFIGLDCQGIILTVIIVSLFIVMHVSVCVPFPPSRSQTDPSTVAKCLLVENVGSLI